jgi:hypothetical protein
MSCDEAKDLLLISARGTGPELAAHLASCRDCAQLAARHQWLDELLAEGLLTAPPPVVAARSLAAALAARPLAAPQSWSTVERVVRASPPRYSLAVYLLAGLVIALAASLLGPVSAMLVTLAAQAISALTLVASSPAVWLLPGPSALAAQLTTWLSLIALAVGLRLTRTGASRS